MEPPWPTVTSIDNRRTREQLDDRATTPVDFEVPRKFFILSDNNISELKSLIENAQVMFSLYYIHDSQSTLMADF